MFGCIPVIIADDIVLPFADAIPWEEIGVFVDEKDVPNLDTILTSIPPDVILLRYIIYGIYPRYYILIFFHLWLDL